MRRFGDDIYRNDHILALMTHDPCALQLLTKFQYKLIGMSSSFMLRHSLCHERTPKDT